MTWEGLSPPYGTIVADPPWGYEGMTTPWRSTTEQSYQLMPTAEIAALPICDLAAGNAHLYLWAVLPMMREAFGVLHTWGFTPLTMLTWCKPGPGLGGGYRGNTEHLIVAHRTSSWGWATMAAPNPTCSTCGGRARGARRCSCVDPTWRVKGEPVAADALAQSFTSTAEGTWYEAPRAGHSAKPPLFADLIERMSPGPYVELFARAPRLGWDHWGHGYEIGAAS